MAPDDTDGVPVEVICVNCEGPIALTDDGSCRKCIERAVRRLPMRDRVRFYENEDL